MGSLQEDFNAAGDNEYPKFEAKNPVTLSYINSVGGGVFGTSHSSADYTA